MRYSLSPPDITCFVPWNSHPCLRSLCYWANRSGFRSLWPAQPALHRCQLPGDGPFWLGETWNCTDRAHFGLLKARSPSTRHSNNPKPTGRLMLGWFLIEWGETVGIWNEDERKHAQGYGTWPHSVQDGLQTYRCKNSLPVVAFTCHVHK